MKYIVPLFRQNAGRVNLGLLNWDSFQAGFRMLMRGDKFAGVIWDPWGRERKSEARRNGQRRTIGERRSHDKARDRLYSEGESVQPLRLVHERRTNWKRRDGSDRRKSASREKLVSFEVFIRELRNRALSDENGRLLIRLWAGLTKRRGASAIHVRGMDKLTVDAVREIEQIHSSWIEFKVAGEDHSLMALCADDIELWPPDAQPVLGRAPVPPRLVRPPTIFYALRLTVRRTHVSN